MSAFFNADGKFGARTEPKGEVGTGRIFRGGRVSS